MMFQNTAFGNKWFYAFIKGVEYINNSATEVEYEIDVMQTWYFDYDVGESFVEREHSETDDVGDNIVPENVETGELISVAERSVEFPKMLGGIVLKKRVDGWTQVGSSTWYHFTQTFVPISINNSPMGIPFGLYIIYGLPVDYADKDYWKTEVSSGRPRYELYNISDLYTYPDDGTGHPDRDHPHSSAYVNLNEVIGIISNGGISGLSGNDIADVFMYPAEFALKENMQRAQNNGLRALTSYATVEASARPDVFYSAKNISDSYDPKNNKMFTFPFVQLKVSNNMGSEAYYHFEDFVGDTPPKFSWYGYTMSGASIFLVPLSYKGVRRNYDFGLSYNNFPTPAFTIEQFAAWFETNRHSAASSLIASCISSATSIGGIMKGANLYGIAGVSANTFNAVNGQLANVRDIQNAPPQVAGQITNDAMNTALNRTGFHFYSLAIRAEMARVVDDYFTMFGYAVKRVKVPNVRRGYEHMRQKWNYVKTAGCIIHHASGTGLPTEDEKKIAEVYDKGITFWTNMSEVGNYSLDNALPVVDG
jgi:hypothetical protein